MQGTGSHPTLAGNVLDPNVQADGKMSQGQGVGGTSEQHVREEGLEHIKRNTGSLSSDTGSSGLGSGAGGDYSSSGSTGGLSSDTTGGFSSGPSGLSSGERGYGDSTTGTSGYGDSTTGTTGASQGNDSVSLPILPTLNQCSELNSKQGILGTVKNYLGMGGNNNTTTESTVDQGEPRRPEDIGAAPDASPTGAAGGYLPGSGNTGSTGEYAGDRNTTGSGLGSTGEYSSGGSGLGSTGEYSSSGNTSGTGRTTGEYVAGGAAAGAATAAGGAAALTGSESAGRTADQYDQSARQNLGNDTMGDATNRGTNVGSGATGGEYGRDNLASGAAGDVSGRDRDTDPTDRGNLREDTEPSSGTQGNEGAGASDKRPANDDKIAAKRENKDSIPTAGGEKLGAQHWGESKVVPENPKPQDAGVSSAAGQPTGEFH